MHSRQLLTTLKATDRATYDQLLNDSIYVNGAIDSAEVISKFLEYVADGKITNVQKAKGISGLFGVMVQKTFGSDYDFNFKGEQDIFNFVVGMAQKIKSGQLTTIKCHLRRSMSVTTTSLSWNECSRVWRD